MMAVEEETMMKNMTMKMKREMNLKKMMSKGKMKKLEMMLKEEEEAAAVAVAEKVAKEPKGMEKILKNQLKRIKMQS
jgi:hypothetical protein